MHAGFYSSTTPDLSEVVEGVGERHPAGDSYPPEGEPPRQPVAAVAEHGSIVRCSGDDKNHTRQQPNDRARLLTVRRCFAGSKHGSWGVDGDEGASSKHGCSDIHWHISMANLYLMLLYILFAI